MNCSQNVLVNLEHQLHLLHAGTTKLERSIINLTQDMICDIINDDNEELIHAHESFLPPHLQ